MSFSSITAAYRGRSVSFTIVPSVPCRPLSTHVTPSAAEVVSRRYDVSVARPEVVCPEVTMPGSFSRGRLGPVASCFR